MRLQQNGRNGKEAIEKLSLMLSKIAKHIFFSGRVQGVGFRFTAHRIAMRYGLAGYVCNTHDGKVEVLVQGGSREIDNFVRDLRETFTVDDVNIEDVPINKQYDRFNITF